MVIGIHYGDEDAALTRQHRKHIDHVQPSTLHVGGWLEACDTPPLPAVGVNPYAADG